MTDPSAPAPDPADTPTSDTQNGSTDMTHAQDATRPDQPLHDPLPYGAGFSTTAGTPAYGAEGGFAAGGGYVPLAGYGVGTGTTTTTTPGIHVDTLPARERAGSPVLAVAGLLSLGVAVWAVLGAPALSSTVLIISVLVLLVLVGLMMVVRR